MHALSLSWIMDDLLKILGSGPSGYIEIAFENHRKPSLGPFLFFSITVQIFLNTKDRTSVLTCVVWAHHCLNVQSASLSLRVIIKWNISILLLHEVTVQHVKSFIPEFKKVFQFFDSTEF